MLGNWVVVYETLKGNHVWSKGFATEAEAKALASETRLELMVSGKEKWYRVRIVPPEEIV